MDVGDGRTRMGCASRPSDSRRGQISAMHEAIHSGTHSPHECGHNKLLLPFPTSSQQLSYHFPPAASIDAETTKNLSSPFVPVKELMMRKFSRSYALGSAGITPGTSVTFHKWKLATEAHGLIRRCSLTPLNAKHGSLYTHSRVSIVFS